MFETEKKTLLYFIVTVQLVSLKVSERILDCIEFLDQELISYRYPSCSSGPVVLFGATSSKTQESVVLKSDWDEIWQDCSSNECASIDGVGFRFRCNTLKMASLASFHKQPEAPAFYNGSG